MTSPVEDPVETMTGTVGRQPVVRLAGLPVPVVVSLRFAATAALVHRLAHGQEWLSVEAEDLSELLYKVIGEAGDGSPLKPRWVGLRRALHRMRLPAAAEWDSRVRQGLPPEIRYRVEIWQVRLRRWQRDRAALAVVLDRESRHKAEVLRGIAGDSGFRRGLWQSSRSLAGELDKWLGEPARRPQRQSISRLAKYVTRAATKTSPYSGFGMSGLAAWSQHGPAVQVEPDPARRGVLELAEPIWAPLVSALMRHQLLRESVRIRLNPSAFEQDTRLRFLGQPPAEPVLSLPVTPALQTCLELLRSRPSLTVGQLQEALAPAADLATVTTFVEHLTGAGLLELSPPVPGAAPEPAALADWVYATAGTQLADVAGDLRILARQLAEPVPITDVGGFQARHRSLATTLGSLADRLDMPRSPAEDEPAPVVHDSVVCPGQPVRCGIEYWRAALTDLDQVRHWLAVFDSALPVRLAVRELWEGWFGAAAEVPFLLLHRAVQETASGSGARARELRRLLSGYPAGGSGGASEFESVRSLLRLRTVARAPLRGAAAQRDGVVRVDPADLAAATADWPAWVDPGGPLGCYVQPVPATDGCELVLNLTGTGYGQGGSRLRYLLDRAGAELETEPSPAGLPLAELAGAHGSALNRRQPALPYEIDYPFTGSARPADQRLPLRDLMVGLDPDRQLLELRSRRLGTPLRALALGLLMIPALPPAARLLVLAFGGRPMAHAAVRGGHRPPAGAAERSPRSSGRNREEHWPDSDRVRPYPRVAAGRVVLQRAAWVCGPDAVPRRGAGEDDAAYLLRLTRWRRQAGIPPRCFVRAVPAGNGAHRLDKSRKPLYLDFDNWFLVLAFENALRSAVELVVFEEALPDPEQATQPAGAPRVAEFLIEFGGQTGAVA